MRQKIGVLGGGFDPPHWGHFWVARQVLEAGLGINQVWLLPTNLHPWRKHYAAAEQRLQMCRLLTEGQQAIVVSDLEIKRGGTSYTVATAEILAQDRQREHFWIVGSDALPTLHKWKDAAKLQQKLSFIVFPRPGFPLQKIPASFIPIRKKNIIITNYSASEIRRRIKQNLPVTGLVPEKVANYIYKHKLYQ